MRYRYGLPTVSRKYEADKNVFILRIKKYCLSKQGSCINYIFIPFKITKYLSTLGFVCKFKYIVISVFNLSKFNRAKLYKKNTMIISVTCFISVITLRQFERFCSWLFNIWLKFIQRGFKNAGSEKENEA